MSSSHIQPELQLPVDIRCQPDETTCGPTCLDAVYRYYGDDVSLETVIAGTGRLEQGGTLAVFLALHALKRGYQASIYTYNLHLFDPSWFRDERVDLRERLRRQRAVKDSPKLRIATDAYLDFLELGGEVKFEELTAHLIRRYLSRSIPVLTGLSATYLYQTPREVGETNEFDDIRGEPSGHFVVLCGFDERTRRVRIADPLSPNPMEQRHYAIDVERLIGAIYLGVLTYDANLLVIARKPEPSA